MEARSLLAKHGGAARRPVLGGYGPAIVLGMCIVAAVAVTSIAVYGGPEGSLAEDWAGPAAGINCIASFGALSSLFCPHATGSFTSGAQGAIARQDGASSPHQAARIQMNYHKPVDCSCCKSTCKHAGVFHAMDNGKVHTEKYWCILPHPYSGKCKNVFDYNCICCDVVRDVYHGKQCA